MACTKRKYVLLSASQNSAYIDAVTYDTMADAEDHMDHAVNAAWNTCKQDNLPGRSLSRDGWSARVQAAGNARFWRICPVDLPGYYIVHANGHAHEITCTRYPSKDIARAAMEGAYSAGIKNCTGWTSMDSSSACVYEQGFENSTAHGWQITDFAEPDQHAALNDTGMPQGKPAVPRAFILLQCGSNKVRAYADEVAAALSAYYGREDIEKDIPDFLSVGVEQGDTSITATVEPKEADYPHVTVDGHSEQNGTYWLGEFELPCGEYPDRFTARLYAGCEKDEAENPIALVSHDVRSIRKVPDSENYSQKKKLIYVDYDSADTRTWTKSSQDDNPEHREDELK